MKFFYDPNTVLGSLRMSGAVKSMPVTNSMLKKVNAVASLKKSNSKKKQKKQQKKSEPSKGQLKLSAFFKPKPKLSKD